MFLLALSLHDGQYRIQPQANIGLVPASTFDMQPAIKIEGMEPEATVQATATVSVPVQV